MNSAIGAFTKRKNYYCRIFSAYLTSKASQLTFWHETPEVNEFNPGELGPYYMRFAAKADYTACLDDRGVPLLDYHGTIGPQYNPIAIAQYSLGNYNRYCATGSPGRRQKFLATADWLVEHLETNPAGLRVWNHHFDWDYRSPLKAPWYSGLAQGQGISALVRAFMDTGSEVYMQAATAALQPFFHQVADGGVIDIDSRGDVWFEEYLVSPPTHILNGFIWASWGVYDYWLTTREERARELVAQAVHTLLANLDQYDVGYWSLYEQSATRLRMLASPFYHRLHITQLRIMYQLTGEPAFAAYARRWDSYMASRTNRTRALFGKSIFKLCYY